ESRQIVLRRAGVMPATASGRAAFGAAPGVPAVAAEKLELASAELAKEGKALNTRRAYESDWASWEEFCEAHSFVPLPADPEQVKLYLTHLTTEFGLKGEKLRPRTAERHLAAIATTHCAEGLTFDRHNPALVKTLDGIRRKFDVSQKGARALRTEDIIALCGTFGRDIRSLRNKAIILLGFAGGFRRSEIVGLNAEDLKFKEGNLRVTLRRSKTDQEGKGRTIVILPGQNLKTCPVAAVRAWLEAAELKDEGGDPIFRPVNRHSSVELNRLSDRAVDLIVKDACRAAHLKESYSAHSLRAGHVTEALARGAGRASVKRQTGHASDTMLDRYDREADPAADNSSAALGL
ncbi:MAG: site-specific integrase, partial [Terracidiphilus sp.]